MWNKGELLLSKTLTILMILANICVWLFMASKRVDMLLSVWMFVFPWMVVLIKLKKLFGPLNIKLVPFALSNSFWTTFWFTSMISGDLDPKDEVSRVCLGQTHMHHWMVFTLLLLWF